jgi:hypothetical protein
MFLVLSLLHLGDLKRSTSERIEQLRTDGQTAVVYRGLDPSRSGMTYDLAAIETLSPEEQNDILGTQAGFGGERLPAPQASLMAVVARGIIESKTELILVLTGMLMGLALIMMQVRSPMLICVGMYLPIDTTFAIFIGGAIRGLLDRLQAKRKIEGPAKESMDNTGVLLASGLIAGEALIGLLFAGLAFAEFPIPQVFDAPSYLVSLALMGLLSLLLVLVPLRRKNA